MGQGDQIRILLVHADHPRLTHKRMIGAWSYPVPEFAVQEHLVKDGYTLKARDWRDKVDVIFVEDSRAAGELIHDEKVPIIYRVEDSTLSDLHYKQRLRQARGADLILLDWDRRSRFNVPGEVRNWSYCVNDYLFHTNYGGKTVDVGFYCNMDTARRQLDYLLSARSDKSGFSYLSGVRFESYYPKSMCRTRIIVNWNRNSSTRAHRQFDALACGAVVVTGPYPKVMSDHPHEAPWIEETTLQDIPEAVTDLLNRGPEYLEMKREQGLIFINKYHTWRVRARELRSIISQEFNL